MPAEAVIARFRERGVAPSFLAACLLLGGASGAGDVANATLQLIALLALLFLVQQRTAMAIVPSARSLLLLTTLAAALMLIQLLPLPPAIWALFPGRAPIVAGYNVAGVAPPWLPLTLVPDGTIAALLSLLPPVAMFLVTIASSAPGRRSCVYVLVGGAAASILLGMMQELHAIDYIYDFTSFGGPVGFFANRNHLATLCLMAMPLGASLAISSGTSGLDRRIGRRLIAGSAVGILTLGVIIVESMAGWMFLAPTLIGCWLVYERGELGALRRRTAWAAGVVVALGLVAAVYASLTFGDLNQQTNGINPRERRESIRLTADAARDYLPLGSGFGSFQSIYPGYENPRNVTLTYVNHAHSDYVELLLESGLAGVLLLGGFLLWWLRRYWPIWKPGSDRNAFARAAFVAVAVPLAHSLVDYPLRTAAIAAVTAFCCGLLVSQDSQRTEPTQRSRSRHSDAANFLLGLPGRGDVAAIPLRQAQS